MVVYLRNARMFLPLILRVLPYFSILACSVCLQYIDIAGKFPTPAEIHPEIFHSILKFFDLDVSSR
jgi:hypothetical protein